MVLIEYIDMYSGLIAKVRLEHWRALLAVVDQGGYAKAAEALGKSQSTVSHSISRLEELLGTGVLKVKGRKAVLTPVGEVMVRRARVLLNEAADMERVARTLAGGVEAEVHIAVDTVFPNQILLPAFKNFSTLYPDTRIELHETVISGIEEMMVTGKIQLAITPHVPPGWLGEPLIRLEMCCVAHPEHALHQLGRPANKSDLMQYTHLVVRETSEDRDSRVSLLSSEKRLTVSTMATRIQALCQGLGFAWSPVLKIRRELAEGLLKPLPMEYGASKFIEMYLFLADEDGAGPATKALAGEIRKQADYKEGSNKKGPDTFSAKYHIRP